MYVSLYFTRFGVVFHLFFQALNKFPSMIGHYRYIVVSGFHQNPRVSIAEQLGMVTDFKSSHYKMSCPNLLILGIPVVSAILGTSGATEIP